MFVDGEIGEGKFQKTRSEIGLGEAEESDLRSKAHLNIPGTASDFLDKLVTRQGNTLTQSGNAPGIT